MSASTYGASGGSNFPVLTVGLHTLTIVTRHANNTIDFYIDGTKYASNLPQWYAGQVTTPRCGFGLWHTGYGKVRLKAFKYYNYPYKELNYIESSGTQYINTGIVGRNGIKVEVTLDTIAIDSSRYFFGANASSMRFGFVLLNSTSFRSDYNTALANCGTPLANTTFKILKDDNKTYINDVLVFTSPQATFNTGYTMYLCCCNTGGVASPAYAGRWRTCKIWDENSILVRDYIPVFKDGITYCMFDKVSQTYFYNIGTGSFTGV
jgi:hypothetical protein